MTFEEFSFLARRAGLTLTAEQLGEIYPAYDTIEEMVRRVRTPRGREAEPAHIFVFAQGAGA